MELETGRKVTQKGKTLEESSGTQILWPENRSLYV